MSKVPRQLRKQVENLEEVIKSLNGLIDGSKIKLEYYDEGFLKELSEIRKSGLELRDNIEVFKNRLEDSASDQYESDSNSRFEREASEKRIYPPGVKTWRNVKAAQKIIDKYLVSKPQY